MEEMPGFPNTKPDIAAPGVNIMAARAGGGYESYTGTSLCNPSGDGGCGADDGMGDRKGKGSLFSGGKAEGFSKKGSKECARGENLSE